MNCQQFREILHDVARDETLGSGTVREALEHAEQCRECDALLDEAEVLTASLRALAKRDAGQEAPARVEAALLRAFREHHAVAPRPVRRGLWALVAFGTAAAVVLFAIVLVHSQKLASHAPGAVSGLASVASTPLSGPLVASGESDLSLTSDPSVDFMDGWPLAYQGSATVGSFVALSETFDPTKLDVNSVVRVAMSRPALARLGVYLDGDGDGPVVADLAVSSDGTPEAVRVVEW